MTTRRDLVSVTCPVCREPIAEDDPIVKVRGRLQLIHVRCWRLGAATEEAEDKREEGGAA